MSYTISHNTLLGVIEVIFKGGTTAGDLVKITSECISIGDETHTAKFLVDTSDIELAASSLDIINLPNQYAAEHINRFTRIALIQPTSAASRESVHFYETVCVNRGWFVKIFTDRQSAMDWLLNA